MPGVIHQLSCQCLMTKPGVFIPTVQRRKPAQRREIFAQNAQGRMTELRLGEACLPSQPGHLLLDLWTSHGHPGLWRMLSRAIQPEGGGPTGIHNSSAHLFKNSTSGIKARVPIYNLTLPQNRADLFLGEFRLLLD